MLALAKKHRLTLLLTLLFLRMEKDLRTVGERVREWLDLGLGFVLGGWSGRARSSHRVVI